MNREIEQIVRFVLESLIYVRESRKRYEVVEQKLRWNALN